MSFHYTNNFMQPRRQKDLLSTSGKAGVWQDGLDPPSAQAVQLGLLHGQEAVESGVHVLEGEVGVSIAHHHARLRLVSLHHRVELGHHLAKGRAINGNAPQDLIFIAGYLSR